MYNKTHQYFSDKCHCLDLYNHQVDTLEGATVLESVCIRSLMFDESLSESNNNNIYACVCVYIDVK